MTVFDEGHRLKNPSSQLSMAAGRLVTNSRFILSGTAVQNNLMELHTLVSFCDASIFGEKGNFKKSYVAPIGVGHQITATVEQVNVARRKLERLCQRLRPVLLRRTKAIIRDQLPLKNDRVLFCDISQAQRDAYNGLLDSNDFRFLYDTALYSEQCQQASKTSRADDRAHELYLYELYGFHARDRRYIVFPCLVSLRKVGNHLALLVPSDIQRRVRKRNFNSFYHT